MAILITKQTPVIVQGISEIVEDVGGRARGQFQGLG